MNKSSHSKTILLAATSLGMGLTHPAWAQTDASAEGLAPSGNDIVVTAQRTEQRLQDVPISITVLDEGKIANNNIQSARDIATYTPGLTVNTRFGGDNTTFAVRGFSQQARTTSTVGTYFADVVALRGSGATPGGDGAGPGALFDLQNVQVLKGPQGTLFGRNSTGGAVLLVPRKPTDQFEGYVEGSVGNYGFRRGQGVVNVPVGDSFRFRLAVDRNKRDGYLENAGRIGSGPYGKGMGSIDYWAVRASAVMDLTPDLENYTIATYSKSKSSGMVPKLTSCFPGAGATGVAACNQMTREEPLGYWSVSNGLPTAGSVTQQWQLINTTTWQASDALTVKNILSYGELRGQLNLDLFGLYMPIVPPGTETNGSQVKTFNTSNALPGGYTNAQSSLVEELQLQGNAANGRLAWQGGLYLEVNDPLGLSGTVSTTQTPCADINSLNCVPFTPPMGASSLGRLGYSTTRNEFRGKALYFQSSYNLTDQLTITGGIRYTWDKMRSVFQVVDMRLGNMVGGVPTDFASCINTPTFGTVGSATNPRRSIADRFGMCVQDRTVKTSAPTWLIGMDYKPVDDILLYMKWSRGYRQGGVASFAGDRLQDYGAEKVDTYEVGAKTKWSGIIPGHFNISAFYNDFRDQQLQTGLQCFPSTLCPQTTAVINAGKSRLYGLEAEAGVSPLAGLKLEVSYAYLNTKVTAVADLAPIIAAAGLPYNDIRPITVGSQIPGAMPHKATASAVYTLPLPEAAGSVSLGGTFVYQSAYRVVNDAVYGSNNGVLPSSYLLNLSVNWDDVMGLPVDAAFFMTNVTNEKVFLHVNDQQLTGFVSHLIGEPRMYAVRLKYRFGA